MATPKRSLYDILGVAPDALPLDIGLAYQKRLAALQDAVPQDTSEIALVRQAHEVLSNPKRRAAYDASRVTESERAAAREQAQAPDLVVEGDEEQKPRPRIPPVGIGIGIVVLLIVAYLLLRPSAPEAPPPPPPPVAEAPPPPPPPPQPKPAKDILVQAQKSVGRVQGFEMTGRAVPLGLALAVDDGAMVTTCHGIPAGSQLVVSIGTEIRSATLLVTDETLDLCRLSVAPPLVPVALAEHEPRAGDTVYAMGANADGELALTEGKVKRLVPDSRGPMIELSMPVAPNGSGGPVFDAYGKLAAIATTSQSHGAGVSLAIPVSWIAQMRSRETAPAR
jgi:S1-C subfamily serine protease